MEAHSAHSNKRGRNDISGISMSIAEGKSKSKKRGFVKHVNISQKMVQSVSHLLNYERVVLLIGAQNTAALHCVNTLMKMV